MLHAETRAQKEWAKEMGVTKTNQEQEDGSSNQEEDDSTCHGEEEVGVAEKYDKLHFITQEDDKL